MTASKIKSNPKGLKAQEGGKQYIDRQIKDLDVKISENTVLLSKIEEAVKMIAHYSGNNRVLTECKIEHWVLDSKHKRKIRG